MSRMPLEGYRVIDMTEVWAGPFANSLLGDLGAEVIRVESYPREGRGGGALPRLGQPGQAPPSGPVGLEDAPRQWDRIPDYHQNNRNKLGVAMNVMDPRGKELFYRLVACSDAFIIGYSSGTAERMGVDYETLIKHRSDLVMLSMSAWGERGPYRGYVVWGSGPDAWSGHHLLRGYPDSNPSRVRGSFHLDAISAVTVAFAILTALHYRERTGKGQFIDFSMAEVLLNHLPRPLMDWVMNKRVAEPIGNVDPDIAPCGCYPCSQEDSWAVIVVRSDSQWQGLKRALGAPAWAEDPRFDSVAGRVQARGEIDLKLSEWTRQRTHREVMQTLQAEGVAAAPVYRTDETFADPHLKARGFYRWVTHPLVGQYQRPGPPFELTGTPIEFRRHVNLLGEHNREVLRGLLGVSEAKYQELVADSVVGDEYKR